MGVFLTLLRLLCGVVGVTLAALYVTGYTHERPLLTPKVETTTKTKTNKEGEGRHDSPTTTPSTQGTCEAADGCDPATTTTTPASYPSDAPDDDDACHWWTPDKGKDTDTLCSAFALRRLMGSDALARALESAKKCAILHGTSCVLSHEVDLQVPAVMLWDSTTSAMRMFLLPRIVTVPEGTLYDVRRVAVVRPPFDDDVARSRTPLIVQMNRSVEVDHVSTTSHARESEHLLDEDAYCMQMLKLTIPDRCNEEL